MSAVRSPESSTASTAASTASASRAIPKEYRSIIAAERMVPIGLARSRPAMSGAEPWIGSYTPKESSRRLAEGIMPIEPTIMLDSSERMSPNMFSVTSTSNCEGSRTSCMAALSTSMSISSTSGYSADRAWARSFQRREQSRTLDFSTEVRRFLRFLAASKPTRRMRSISCSE